MSYALRRFAGILVLSAAVATAACVQTTSRSINQLPMYGGVAKTQAQRDADRAFIERIEKQGHTRKDGARKSVALGWRYFFEKGDLATAMKRFNQAWLLDPDNPDAYHGFAVVTYVRDHDVAAADGLFRRALEKGAQTVGVYSDYGRFLGEIGRLPESVEMFRKAIAVDPKHLVSHQGLVVSLARMGKHAEACDQLRASSALGLRMEPGFASALAALSGKPCTESPAR